MPHEFDSGAFLREPAWHRLGTVVDEWPGSWPEARKLAGLEWEVTPMPLGMQFIDEHGVLRLADVSDEVILLRNDKPQYQQLEHRLIVNPEAKLAIQPSSYAIIYNEDFGQVIEQVVGKIGGDFAYETLISLQNGKLVVALLRCRTPLQIACDPSLTHTYFGLTSRHDGNGGLRAVATNVRVVCQNTHTWAEEAAKRERVGWTIRHTATWKDRIEQLSNTVAAALRDGKAWEGVANKLGSKKLIPAQLDKLLERTFRIDSGMNERQVQGVEDDRTEVRAILTSKTCEHIEHTMYGFVQAVDEWSDHVKPARSDESRFTRAWMRVEPVKTRALQLALAASDA